MYLRLGARSVPPQNGSPLRHDHLDRLTRVRAPLALASGTASAQLSGRARARLYGHMTGTSRKMAICIILHSCYTNQTISVSVSLQITPLHIFMSSCSVGWLHDSHALLSSDFLSAMCCVSSYPWKVSFIWCFCLFTTSRLSGASPHTLSLFFSFCIEHLITIFAPSILQQIDDYCTLQCRTCQLMLDVCPACT